MVKSCVFKGIPIEFELKGKAKRTVVLLHGFLESYKIWEDYAKSLSKTNTVISISLPGHGNSGCLGYIHTMEEMAEAIKSVLNHCNKRKAIVVGHSLGGYVALAFADLFPDTINGLCLFNSTAKPDSAERKNFRDRTIEVVKKNHQLFIKEAIPNLFIDPKTPAIRGAIKKTINIALTTPVQGIVATLEGMKIRIDREIILNFAPYPVLCIAGKNDPIIPWEESKRQSSLSEKGEFYLSEKGGHMCFFEDKYPCLKALHKFIIKCKKL